MNTARSKNTYPRRSDIMQPMLVLLGGETYTLDICNTYTYAKLQIDVKKDLSVKVSLAHADEVIDVTSDCKGMKILDTYNYKRTQREIQITIGKDTLYGIYRVRQDKDLELQFLKMICKSLSIPCEYEIKEDDYKTRQEKAQSERK